MVILIFPKSLRALTGGGGHYKAEEQFLPPSVLWVLTDVQRILRRS